MVEPQASVQIPRVVYPLSRKEMDERRQRQAPEPTLIDEDGAWYSKEHKEYVMQQKSYWEEQHKTFKADEEAQELSEQYAF